MLVQLAYILSFIILFVLCGSTFVLRLRFYNADENLPAFVKFQTSFAKLCGKINSLQKRKSNRDEQ